MLHAGAEASKARALKKAADLGQLSVLDSLKEEEEDAEAEKLAEEKGGCGPRRLLPQE